MFAAGDSESVVPSSSRSSDTPCATYGESELMMGWAIPKRNNRTLTPEQKNFLNKLFDQGECTGSKVSGEDALKLMKEQLERSQFLPLTSIKSYFSRRAKKLREGKTEIGELFPVTGVEKGKKVEKIGKRKNKKTGEKKTEEAKEEERQRGAVEEEAREEEEEAEEEEAEEDEEKEGDNVDQEDANDEDSDNDDGDDDDGDYDNDESNEQRSKIVSRILAFADTTPDLLPDDWIAVDVGSTWFPGQFVQFDSET